jgi:DNA-binding beta-propeller fold protein YncE
MVTRFCSLTLLLTIPGLAFLSLPKTSALSPQEQISYARQITPLLQEKCIPCHNHTVRQGGLNLESFEALMSGGKSGQIVIPGKSAESRLAGMIDGRLKPRMPLGDELSQSEISLIKAWIDRGALSDARPTSAAPETPGVADRPSTLPVIKAPASVRPSVTSLAFSPDGSLLAVGRYQAVELLSPRDSSNLGHLGGHISQVRALAFSPDGKTIASAGGNPAQFGEIKIWSVKERKELRTIRGHGDNIFALAFSPDGSKLATASYDRLIKIWDPQTGSELATLKDHTDAVFALAFSPDGRRLASASADRTVKIWEVASGNRLFTLGDALDGLQTLAFHPNGKQLAAAGNDRVIRIWELNELEGRQIRSLIAHEDAIHEVTYSPDGKLLASTGADKRIKIWDAATLTETTAIEIQPDWVFALSFSPDGKRLVAGRYDGSIAFYDAITGKRLAGK